MPKWRFVEEQVLGVIKMEGSVFGTTMKSCPVVECSLVRDKFTEMPPIGLRS